MKMKVTCIPGDGIGPEIVTEAKKVLEKLITTSEEGSAIYNTSKQLLEEL